MRRFLKILFRLVLLTLAVGLALGGWYINRKGFTREWRQYVNSEFEKHGFSVSINRLTLDPFHGLIARDVEIYDVKNPRKTLAVISQVVLDINYSNLLHHRPFLNGVDLRDTNLKLPVNPSDPQSPRILISNLNARVQMPPGLFNLSKADANIYGIHVSIKGQVTHPEEFHFSSNSSGKPGSMNGLVETLRRIAGLGFEAGAPQLDINFNGDAREPEKIFVEATLRGEKIRSENYRLETINSVINYQDGVVNLKKCVASDSGGGTLDATGKWEPSTGFSDLQLRSTIDIQQISHAFNLVPALEEFVFYDPPAIEISAERNAQSSPAFILTGHAALKKFGYRSVHFEGLNGNFSWDGARWYARDVQLSHRSGKLIVKAMQTPGDFRAEIQCDLNPNFIRPLLSGKAAEALSEFSFIDSPHLQLSVRGTSPDFDACTATGDLQVGRAVLRGSPMDRAVCKLFIKDRAITYQQFRIERGTGVATGSFAYDFGKHEIRLDKIKCDLNPADVAPWINPDIVKSVTPYRFKEHPNLAINGVVQFAGGKNTNLEILVDARDGMDYTFLKKNLSFSSISGRLLFTDGHLQLSKVNGELLDGEVAGAAEISLERSAPNHSAAIQVKNIDFEKLTKLYFDYDNSHGQLAGTYNFTIRSDDARTMEGSGQLTVTNGNIFAIPFLGPFTAILNTIVPGMGYDVARKATANYTIGNSIIETKNFVVQGHGFNMNGDGKLFYLDDKMDFDIRLNAQGLAGVIVNPVGKLFEYTSDSSLSKPIWRPKHLPKL